MKKLLFILLSLLLCLSVFVSCDKETEESSVIPESREESSQAVSASNDVTSETVSEDSSDSEEDESTVVDYVIPEFDKSKVIYNPDEEHYITNDALVSKFAEGTHIGLDQYIKDNDVSNDEWFCVNIVAGYLSEGEIFETADYLEEMGFVRSDVLSTTFKSETGYITKDMFERMRKDNKPIECNWLPKKCVDNGRCFAE